MINHSTRVVEVPYSKGHKVMASLYMYIRVALSLVLSAYSGIIKPRSRPLHNYGAAVLKLVILRVNTGSGWT